MKLKTKNALAITLGKGLQVEKTGGVFGHGLISAVPLATVGPAKGHGFWLDMEFLKQCEAAMGAMESGLKCRATHPAQGSDGLGTYLGKATAPRIDGDRLLGDLNFAEVADLGTMGKMGTYLMSMAQDVPEDVGLSIHFDLDVPAMQAFMLANGGQVTTTTGADGKQTSTITGFKSPDPANTGNLPHFRLSALNSVDAVDEAAANPNGLLSANHAAALAAEVVSVSSESSTSEDSSQYGGSKTNEQSKTVVLREETATEVVYTTTENETVVRTERFPKTPTAPVVDPAVPAPAEALAAITERLAKLETENAGMKVELSKKKFEANTSPGIVPADAVHAGETKTKAVGLNAKVSEAFKAAGLKP